MRPFPTRRFDADPAPVQAPHLHLLTGAPGTGKTAIVDLLTERGFDTEAEPAREILAEHRRPGQVGGGWHGSPDVFAELLLDRSIEKYNASRFRPGPVVFDRGVPDCLAYATYIGTDPIEPRRAAKRFRAAPTAFLTTPWRDIYTTDEDRIMTFDMVERFHDNIVGAYGEAGYDLVEVPQVDLGRRADFIVGFIGRTR